LDLLELAAEIVEGQIATHDFSSGTCRSQPLCESHAALKNEFGMREVRAVDGSGKTM
jgi:hypothetical protein